VLDRLVFVTSSEAKHREAQEILGQPIDRLTLDLVEPQGLDVLAVAREKARLAAILLGRPVLVEDTSLELVALGGFPGPLVRWLLAAAGPAVIARMLDPFPVRDAVARCAAVVRDGDREWVGVGEVLGEIVADPRGAGGFGWDIVFAPEWGGGRTYAEMPAEEKNSRSHRRLAFEALRERLNADNQTGG
jgi:non-canonical purine NTP pyrophosphatase (RdgB/HAM1 family)